MKDLFFLVTDYLKGNSIYPPLRRVLNFIFNVSITSFFYTKFYGEYTWLSFSDYKGILDFLIKGQFIVPFSMFSITFLVTEYIPSFTLLLTAHFITLKQKTKIVNYQVKADVIDKELLKYSNLTKYISHDNLTREKMIELYSQVREHIKAEDLQQLEINLSEPKKNLELNFIFGFRLFVTLFFYFMSLANFGIVLYLAISILVLISMGMIIASYIVIDIVPTFLIQFYLKAEDYYLQLKSNSN